MKKIPSQVKPNITAILNEYHAVVDRATDTPLPIQITEVLQNDPNAGTRIKNKNKGQSKKALEIGL